MDGSLFCDIFLLYVDGPALGSSGEGSGDSGTTELGLIVLEGDIVGVGVHSATVVSLVVESGENGVTAETDLKA